MIVKLTVEFIVNTGEEIIDPNDVGFKFTGPLTPVKLGKTGNSSPREEWGIRTGKMIKQEEIPADWYLTY